MERTERIATSVTPEQKRQIRIVAAERGQNMSELLYQLIEEELDGQEQ